MEKESHSQRLQNALAQFRSFDFWLFVGSFMASVLALQSFDTISAQAMSLAAILVVGVLVSIFLKNKLKWERRHTGFKGALTAVAVILFVGYGICIVALEISPFRGIELDGPVGSQILAALSEPVVFAWAMPFSYLGVYAAASHLGLVYMPGSVKND